MNMSIPDSAKIFPTALLLENQDMNDFYKETQQYLENYPVGFLIIGGIYFVITILLFFIKDRIVEGPILEKFSEIFFND